MKKAGGAVHTATKVHDVTLSFLFRRMHIIYTGSWTRPPNWDLHVTLDGEPCIPFPAYVKRETTCSCNPTFPRFRSLPTELQLHILSFCDAPTLFWLMQVSSVVRNEAKKLFWSIPDTWYLVEGSWLLAGGLSGHVSHDIDFLVNIKRLKVNFDSIERCIADDEEERVCQGPSARSPQSPEERARVLWRTLQSLFPQVTHVVISESKMRKPRGYISKYDTEGFYSADRPHRDLLMIAQMSPVRIYTSISFLRMISDTSRLLERSLWQRMEENTYRAGEWEEVDSAWTRQSILLPPKEFRGPVGIFRYVFFQENRVRLRQNPIRLLRLQAQERHHFRQRHEPFVCFEPSCGARFERPGEWTLHAFGLGRHDNNAAVPDEVKAKFEEHETMIERKHQDIRDIWTKMRADWGEEGSKKRHDARQAFLHQLDHDPLYVYGSPAAETSAWVRYSRFMGTDDKRPIC